MNDKTCTSSDSQPVARVARGSRPVALLGRSPWGSRSRSGLFPAFDALLSPFWGAEEAASSTVAPPLDLRETTDAFLLSVELPGVRREDLDLRFEEDTLVLKASKAEAAEGEDGRLHRSERRFGEFERRLCFGVPVEVDAISASYRDGVLEIRLPKLAEDAKSQRIPIRED